MTEFLNQMLLSRKLELPSLLDGVSRITVEFDRASYAPDRTLRQG